MALRLIRRRSQCANSHENRLARHLFTIATIAPPGKDVGFTGIADRADGSGVEMVYQPARWTIYLRAD
jgi:hypothetical protein